MEEVEILCDQIVIMDQGQVIAKGTKESLKDMVRTADRLTIDIPLLPENVLSAIQRTIASDGIAYKKGQLQVTTTELNTVLLPILTILQEEKISYGKIATKEASLNDVFLEITGKDLRD